MAELPGWTRARLATADPRDVAAARQIAYARVLTPTVQFDVEGRLADLAEAEATGRRAARLAKKRRGEARESLERMRRQRADARVLLMLDEPDEEPADG